VNFSDSATTASEQNPRRNYSNNSKRARAVQFLQHYQGLFVLSKLCDVFAVNSWQYYPKIG